MRRRGRFPRYAPEPLEARLTPSAIVAAADPPPMPAPTPVEPGDPPIAPTPSPVGPAMPA